MVGGRGVFCSGGEACWGAAGWGVRAAGGDVCGDCISGRADMGVPVCVGWVLAGTEMDGGAGAVSGGGGLDRS